MQSRARRATATGAAAFVLAGAAALAAPATASAATKTANCGGSVTAAPGDTVVGRTSLLGITLSGPLGTVTSATSSLSGTLVSGLTKALCTVSVTVDKVEQQVPAAKPVTGVVKEATGAAAGAVDSAGKALGAGSENGNQPAPGSGGNGNQPAPGSGGNNGGNPQQGGPNGNGANTSYPGFPAANSPVLLGGSPGAFAALPGNFSTGFAPMADYSSVPLATAGLYAPSPGIRYGGQVPGYAPEFGVLGADTPQGPPQTADVRPATQAEALPTDGFGGLGSGVQLPMLLAVLALSGATAGLVRTWVLRRNAEQA